MILQVLFYLENLKISSSSGETNSPVSIKVQLQYELLTGSFMKIDIFSGIKADAEYIKVMKKDIKNKDLKLIYLRYFKINY